MSKLLLRQFLTLNTFNKLCKWFGSDARDRYKASSTFVAPSVQETQDDGKSKHCRQHLLLQLTGLGLCRRPAVVLISTPVCVRSEQSAGVVPGWFSRKAFTEPVYCHAKVMQHIYFTHGNMGDWRARQQSVRRSCGTEHKDFWNVYKVTFLCN